jgi:hypothetical protein
MKRLEQALLKHPSPTPEEILLDNQLCDMSSTNPCGTARFMGNRPRLLLRACSLRRRSPLHLAKGRLGPASATDSETRAWTGLARQMHFMSKTDIVLHLDQQRTRALIVEHHKHEVARLHQAAQVLVCLVYVEICKAEDFWIDLVPAFSGPLLSALPEYATFLSIMILRRVRISQKKALKKKQIVESRRQAKEQVKERQIQLTTAGTFLPFLLLTFSVANRRADAK